MTSCRILFLEEFGRSVFRPGKLRTFGTWTDPEEDPGSGPTFAALQRARVGGCWHWNLSRPQVSDDFPGFVTVPLCWSDEC